MTNKKDIAVNEFLSGDQQKPEAVGKQSTDNTLDADNGASEPNDSAVPTELSERTSLIPPSEQPTLSAYGEETRPIASTADPDPTRRTAKQRKSGLCEYRATFLPVPRIKDRKPVFVSGEVRDRLDRIVRLLGERGMSVSGLIENIALQHLAIHEADIEHWRKM